jgi:hypothetical protein
MVFNLRRLLLALLLVATLASCKRGDDFKAYIAKFQQSTETVSEAISIFYTELNQYERTLYLQERLLDDTLRVAIKDNKGNPTPLLIPPFDPEAIQGRIDLLEQIAYYGQQLAALAGNEAPAKTKENLMALSEDLTKLNTRFEDLQETDTEAGKYIGPITTILGVVSKPLLEKKRTAAIQQAIREGQKPINALLTFLEQDLKKYVEATRNTGQRQQIADWVNYYNRHLGKMSLSQRQLLLNHINQAAVGVDLVKRSQPSDVVLELKKMHAALVKYAASGGKPADLGALKSALKSFQEEARQLVETVAAMQKLTSKS